MRRRRPVAVGVDMAVAVVMGVGSGWNHGKVLYYNITQVHRLDFGLQHDSNRISLVKPDTRAMRLGGRINRPAGRAKLLLLMH